VLVEKRGTANLYRVNQRCVVVLPQPADVVMGKAPTAVEAVCS